MPKAVSAPDKRIFRSWIISYGAILILPLIFYLILYAQGYHAMEADYQNTQFTVMNQFAEVMERELMRVNEFSSKVANEEEVFEFFSAASMEDYQKNYQAGVSLRGIENSLFLALPQSSVIHDYLLISPASQLVWIRNGLYRIQDPLLPYPAYIRHLLSLTEDGISGPMLLPQGSGGLLQCSIVYPLPSAYLPMGYLAVTLDSDAVDMILQQMSEANHARLYITGEGGTILYRSKAAADSPVDEQLLTSGEAQQGTRAWMYMRESTTLPIHYHVIAPFEPESATLVYVRWIVLISLLIGIVGSGILIVLVTKRNYSPVQALVETASSQSDVLPQNGSDEYQIVANALRGLYEQRNSIQQVVTQQNKTLFSYYLAELLKNRIPAWEMDEEMLQNIEAELDLQSFCVLLVMTDFSQRETEHEDLLETAAASLYEEQFLERFRSLLGAGYSVVSVPVYDLQACVISILDEAGPNWQSDIREAADQAARQYSESSFCRNYLACSGIYHEVVSLHEAYDEATNLMPYAVVSSNGTVFREEMMGQPAYYPSTDQSDIHILGNLVNTGAYDELRQKLMDVIGRYASENFSFHTLKGISAGLICEMLLAGSPWSENERIQLLHHLSRLDRETTLDQVKEELCETARVICEMKKKTELPNRRETLIQKVEKELEEHLFDENLNIMFLARNLGMNPKYLSTVYQEATGENLIDVIHKRRVECFKKMVREQHLSVKDAAAKVGYASVITLNRWFKKFEGVTPGKWKEG